MISLRDYQQEAIEQMKNGCILNGGVGSGKSLTALAYYFFRECGGSQHWQGDYIPMTHPKDLYIITTAHKRDTYEWDREMAHFLISTDPELSLYKTKAVVDSWNNIGKYADVRDSFFIFDEQRVVGKGAWVKSFLKITKANHWILLSATPGDKWEDYIPVFIANGFYKNRTEFKDRHVIERWYNKNYPQVVGYMHEGRLLRLRNDILIDMDFKRETVSHHEDIYVPYCVETYKDMMRNRWDIWENEPFKNAGDLCFGLRRVVNSDKSRQNQVLELLQGIPKAIIFYNYNYELDILKNLPYSLNVGEEVKVAEWNGHKHEPIPDGDRWVYLVQYTAGCEGWNCIKTDTIIFYSQNYSYKVMVQAAGRTDRMNTPYKDLYYYHLKSRSGIDLAISRALQQKKKFNESGFVKW